MIGDKKEYGRYILTRGSSFYEDEFADPKDGEERELFGCAIPNCWTSLKLIQKKAYNSDTSIFTFELPSSDRRLGLRPGAYLLVRCPGVEHGGGDAIRPYTSISEDSRRGSFDILIKRYDESGEHPDVAARRKASGEYYLPANNYKPPGAASTYIHSLKVGEYLRFKHSEVCQSKISLELLGLREDELFNEPNSHIVGPRSRANSRLGLCLGSAAGSRRPSNSEAKGVDVSPSVVSASHTRDGGSTGHDNGATTAAVTGCTPTPTGPQAVVDSVFDKMMMYGTNPTALFNSSVAVDRASVPVAPFVAPLKDDDLFKASLRHAEELETGSSVHVAATATSGSRAKVISASNDSSPITESGHGESRGERGAVDLMYAPVPRGATDKKRERDRLESKIAQPPTPTSTPELECAPGGDYYNHDPDLGAHSVHEETKEAPFRMDTAEGDPRPNHDDHKRFSASSSDAPPQGALETPDKPSSLPLTPTAPSAPPPSHSAGRPRPPSTGRSSFSNSPRTEMNRRRQGSFETSNDYGTATSSTASSPGSSRVHTPSGGRIRTPPRVDEGKEDEPSPDPPIPPSSSDEGNIGNEGSHSAGASESASTRSSRGTPGGQLSRAQSLNWGNSLDAKVESLTLVAVGVGVSPMIRILRAALELSTKLNIAFFFGVREVKDILMREMLEQLANTHTHRFKLVYCVGSRYNNIHMGANAKNKGEYRPPPVPEGYEDLDRHEENIYKKLGWIDHEVLCQHAPPPSDAHRVVVCGLPGVYDKLCGSRFENGVLPEDCVLARLGFSPHQVIKM